MTLSLSLLGLLASPLAVSGYGSGAPASACSDMKPGPPHWPNQLEDNEIDNPPFNLEVKTQRHGQVTGDIIMGSDHQSCVMLQCFSAPRLRSRSSEASS